MKKKQMMNKIYKHLLAASLLMTGGTAMAQTLNSAYFTDYYKFRHDMNPAFENKQNYIIFPALGNINVNLQGNFGMDHILGKTSKEFIPLSSNASIALGMSVTW